MVNSICKFFLFVMSVMIESYFIKSGKRKEQEDKDLIGEKPVKLAKNDDSTSVLKCEDGSIPSDEISLLLERSLSPKWQNIAKENLNLQYGILFNADTAYKIYKHLEDEIKYEKESKVQVFGKWHNVPRKQASYGDEGLKYTFSGATVAAKPWTPLLSGLRDILVTTVGTKFNFVLINRYKDGNDHMGEHKDDEKELVRGSPIASLSFGQERDFIFRHQDSRGSKAIRKIEPVKLSLQSGSILLMKHPTNTFWYHSLPVRKKCLGTRINLTFREMQRDCKLK